MEENNTSYINNSNPSDLTEWEQNFIEDSRFWTHQVFVPTIVLIRTIGNLLTVYIISYRNQKQNIFSSSGIYLSSLGIADIIALVSGFYQNLEYYWINPQNSAISQAPKLYLEFKAHFFSWINLASFSCSIWIITAFTIERYKAVAYPFQNNSFIRTRRQYNKSTRKIILILYIICFFTTIPVIFEETVTEIKPEIYKIIPTKLAQNSAYLKTVIWFHSIMYAYIPVPTMIILNIIIIFTIRKNSKDRKILMINSSEDRKLHYQNNTNTIILIGIVLIFVICHGIQTLFLFLYTTGALEKMKKVLIVELSHILNLLTYVNSACNFLLYTGTSKKFRKELWKLILCQS